MKKILLAAMFVAVASVSKAQTSAPPFKADDEIKLLAWDYRKIDETKFESDLKTCLVNNNNSSGFARCHAAAQQIREKQVADEIAKLKKTTDAKGIALLDKSNTDWKKYIDDQFAFINYATKDANGIGGGMETRALYYYRSYKDRAMQLKNILGL